MKRVKGGTESAEQKDFRELMISEGYRAVVCHGWLNAKDEIESYLKLSCQA